jgi:hypothetical protein
VETKITKLESKLTFLMQKADTHASSKQAQVDENTKLQNDINILQDHIRIISQQNEELTKELDQFVKANEDIR